MPGRGTWRHWRQRPTSRWLACVPPWHYLQRMISPQDVKTIRETAQRYGLKRVLLFGSAADSRREPRDIDLAVEGLEPARFFQFHGDLLLALSLPVDVFDLSQSGRFAELVRQEGVPIYG